MILRNQVALVPTAVLPAPLPTCVLQVIMAHDVVGRRSLHFSLQKCLSQRPSSCTTALYKTMQPRSDTKGCIHFTSNSKETLRLLSIYDGEIVLPRLQARALSPQHKSSTSFKTTARHYSLLVQDLDYPKSARPSVYTRSSPCRSNSAFFLS